MTFYVVGPIVIVMLAVFVFLYRAWWARERNLRREAEVWAFRYRAEAIAAGHLPWAGEPEWLRTGNLQAGQ